MWATQRRLKQQPYTVVRPTLPAILFPVFGVGIISFVVIFFGVNPLRHIDQNVANYNSLKEYHELKNAARATFAQALGGLGLLIGLYFTGLSLWLTHKGQITDRFTRAINQLGEGGLEKLAVRLGGIYALEQIAKNSKDTYEEYHWPIMEVLTAYVRENAPWPPKRDQELIDIQSPPGDEALMLGFMPRRPPAADIQAILTVIGRRAAIFDIEKFTRRMRRIDLHDTDLRRAFLSGALLRVADLRGALLSGAVLSQADLRGALLFKAHLSGADLYGAYLSGANLSGADLTDAILIDADLSGARLEHAIGLTREQIKSAVINEETKLPDDLRKQLEES